MIKNTHLFPKTSFHRLVVLPNNDIAELQLTQSLYIRLRGNTSVNFLENRFSFGLKFSLNLLEYEAKDFIQEKCLFLFNFAFFLRRVGRLSYGYLRYEPTCSEGTQETQLKTFNAFFSKHVFSKRHAL